MAEFPMHLDSIDSGRGFLVLGMSCLEGDCWDGSLVTMELGGSGGSTDDEDMECLGSGSDSDSAAIGPVDPNSLISKSVHIPAGVSVARVIESGSSSSNCSQGTELVACGRDDGILTLYSRGIEELCIVDWHDACVTHISEAKCGGASLATCSANGSLALWDIEAILGCRNISNSNSNSNNNNSSNISSNLASASGTPLNSSLAAHNGNITCVDWSSSDANLLCSSGRDGLLRLWDRRASLAEGAIQIFDAGQIGTTCHWNAWSETEVFVGLADGYTNVYDTRSNRSHARYDRFRPHSSRVRRIQTLSESPRLVLSCSDDGSIAVHSWGNSRSTASASNLTENGLVLEEEGGTFSYSLTRRIVAHADFITDFCFRKPNLSEPILPYEYIYSVSTDKCLRRSNIFSGVVSSSLI